MSSLFQPLKIKNITFRNRIAVSPMCQYSASDGLSTDWHLVHLGSRAVGGAGLVMAEATAVSPEGRISPGDLGVWRDEHIQGLKRIAEFIISQGAVPGIQLAHAGRKASCAVPWEGGKQLDDAHGGWQTLAPSHIPFNEGDRIPALLDEPGINKILSDFKSATQRALRAGFKVIEIHSAHGYLLSQFLSPLSNHRTDEYGGSFRNRIRLLLKVIETVRTVWPTQNPLFVRLSCTEWTEGGWTLEDSIKLAPVLKENGVDLIDCSSGGNINHAKIPVAPGYQVPFAEAIRKTGILTGAVGMITKTKQAEAIVKSEQADLVLFAREMLRNPYFGLRAAQDSGVEVNWPIQYSRAKPYPE